MSDNKTHFADEQTLAYIAKLEAERDKLEARVQEISEMCDIEYRHKVAFMARTTELEAERNALRDEVAQCAGYDDWAEYAALQKDKP